MTQTDELRKLDAAVAKVMGHKVHYNDAEWYVTTWHEGADAPVMCPPGYSIMDSVGYTRESYIGEVFPVPRYSKDPAAMMDVIRYMRDRGYEFALIADYYRDPTRPFAAEFDRHNANIGETTYLHGERAATPMEAVARAALAALGGDDDTD